MMNTLEVKKDVKKCCGTLDVLKLFLAIAVVSVHTSIHLDKYNKFVHLFITNMIFAIPFFIMASSYFLFKKYFRQDDLSDYSLLTTFAKKTTILYLRWSAIYLPITIYGFIHQNYSLKQSVWTFFQSLFLTGDSFYCWAFWYLLGAIVGMIIVRELLKRGFGTKSITIISIVFFALGKLLLKMNTMQINPAVDKAVDLYFKVFGTTRNGLFFSFLFTALGMLLAKHQVNIKRPLLLLISVGCFIACCIIPDNTSFVYFIFNVPLSMALFLFCLKSETKQRNFYKFSRLGSKVVYFTHMIFLFVFTFLIPIKKIFPENAHLITGSSVLACTLILSVIVYYLQKNQKCKFLAKIF